MDKITTREYARALEQLEEEERGMNANPNILHYPDELRFMVLTDQEYDSYKERLNIKWAYYFELVIKKEQVYYQLLNEVIKD